MTHDFRQQQPELVVYALIPTKTCIVTANISDTKKNQCLLIGMPYAPRTYGAT